MQWEQSCHHQPWHPSSSESQAGPLQSPLTPCRDPPAPAGECPRAGAPERTNAGTGSPGFPPSLGPRAGDFSLLGSIRPNDQDRI